MNYDYTSTTNVNIEDLVKTSKQLQNKMRQELQRQVMSASAPVLSELEELPPIWNQIMFNPYVKNVVADYLVESKNLPDRVSKKKGITEKPMRDEQDKLRIKDGARSFQRTQVKKTRKLEPSESAVSFEKSYKSIGTQAARELPTKDAVMKKPPKTSLSTLSRNKQNLETQRSVSKTGRSISFSDLKKSPTKPTVSAHRFPLQRFVGSSKGIIDFSKVHPNLELDMTGHQTTLFPRRFYKGTKAAATPRTPTERELVNRASSKPKKSEVEVPEKDETWKTMLLRNRPAAEKPIKVLHLTKSVDVVDHCKEKHVPASKAEEPIGIDVISTPYHGLFRLEKQNDPSAKQKKRNLQRLPVLYIRPECQVQRVANVSIRGDNDTRGTGSESYLPNVKYVECIHEESKKSEVGSEQVTTKCVTEAEKEETEPGTKPKEQSSQDTPMEKNKFFKAFKFTESFMNSSLKSDTLSHSPSKLSDLSASESSAATTYLCSLSKALQSSSPSSISTSENDVQFTVEKDFTSPSRPVKDILQTKDQQTKIRSPSFRDICVQTDPNEMPAIPVPLPAKSMPPPKQELTVPIVMETKKSTHPLPAASGHATLHGTEIKQSGDNLNEDDFISQIFERIRRDIPQAFQAFKARSLTTHHDPVMPGIEEQQEQKAKQQYHEMSAISKPSNVKLLPERAEPEVIEAKRHDDIGCTVVQMPPPDDTPAIAFATATGTATVKTLPMGEECRKFPMAQQNALFEQTINKIKSSAVHDGMGMLGDVRLKEDRHKYPTDAEVKRAVKIFLDSLTLDGGDEGGSKSIAKGADVRRKLTFPMATTLKSRGQTSKYINPVIPSWNSSTTTSSSSSKKDKNLFKKIALNRCDVEESSSSTPISSSDLESESDLDREPSQKAITNSLSDGEVLSAGEV